MIHLADFLQATDGQLVGAPWADTFDDYAYDSRIVAPGQLFVAVITETGDGHDYVEEAIAAGATGVVCSSPPRHLTAPVTVIVVPDTQIALCDYARHILRVRDIEVIGITGSVGKTSTKEAVAAVLSTAHATFRNFGNYNGRYGLPIALGALRPEHHLAVLEMAADSLDEIRDLARLTAPRVGVVTAIGESHLEYMGSRDVIAREKGRLIEALPPDGLAVLNADDERVLRLAERTPAHVVTYGLKPGATDHLWADEVQVAHEGTSLRAHWRGRTVPLLIPLIGAHHVYTALAAAAVGLHHDLSWDEIAAGLATVSPLPGRTRWLAGIKGCHLLDDSYNASPLSCRAALDTLAALPARRRIVILGDMAQLGARAEEAHREVGRACAQVADVLVTKGDLASLAAQEAVHAGLFASSVHVTFSEEDAIGAVADTLCEGDVVLLKGSAAARLEQVTARLLAKPERAQETLPRQHRGWRAVRLQRPGRPTWVEVDLGAIAHNVRQVAEHVGPDVEVLAVLKADGYGHGATRLARTALNNGATWLGVACLGEALTLRHAGIRAPILSLGYTPPWQVRQAVLHDVTVTLFDAHVARALSRAGGDLGRRARAHIKVDTGMGRLGQLPEDVLPFVREIHALPNLELDGILTHMSSADDADLTYTHEQLARFEGVLDDLRAHHMLPRHIHAANSACILRLPRSWYNMVRLGIAMYGLNPSPDCPCPAHMLRALAFKCQIAQVKSLPPGSSISYGRTFTTTRPSRIAVIPVGYADGFRRAPRHWGEVLVRGARAPIVGRVCMDQTMVDVTDIPGVRQGDEVVLIGSQGDEHITVDQVAANLGTINYEVISEILARVPRVV